MVWSSHGPPKVDDFLKTKPVAGDTDTTGRTGIFAYGIQLYIVFRGSMAQT